MRSTYNVALIVARSLFTPLTAPRLRSCSCQLEDDEISGRAYDSETAENRITVLMEREESALRVFPNLIRLLQMLRWGCKLDGCCVHYQPSISPDRLHFQVDQSVFYFSFLLFMLPPSACQVWQSRASASSLSSWYMGRWHTCELTLTHDAKELSVGFACENTRVFLRCGFNRGWECDAIRVLCDAAVQKDSY